MAGLLFAGAPFEKMVEVFAEAGIALRREADVVLLGDERIDLHDSLARARLERCYVDRLLGRLRGVRLHDPQRIWIEATVDVAPGAELWPGVVLRGNTRIGAATVGVGAVLVDTVVEDGAEVRPYTVADGARIGPRSTVGPMAHLRPGAELRTAVKVGNFVEVKKSVLHDGAKASHLSYLGDAEVGPGANIGAGTITCNYDGHNKWRTTIGAGAFIGSNTALVAPITVGEGAIVGAGSTLSADVPPHALGLERAEAKVYEGLARRIHARNRATKMGGN